MHVDTIIMSSVRRFSVATLLLFVRSMKMRDGRRIQLTHITRQFSRGTRLLSGCWGNFVMRNFIVCERNFLSTYSPQRAKLREFDDEIDRSPGCGASAQQSDHVRMLSLF